MNTSAERGGTLHVTKECSEYTGEAGSFCTIASSNFDAIPVGSKVVYAEAPTASGGLDTDIVVNTPRRRHRLRPCGTRWRDPDRHRDTGGWYRGAGETEGGPRGRASR